MRGTNQKLKLLYLKEIFEEETDNEHSISMPRIIEELKKKGVAAERKSVYDDIRLLQEEYGLPIEHEEGARRAPARRKQRRQGMPSPPCG